MKTITVNQVTAIASAYTEVDIALSRSHGDYTPMPWDLLLIEQQEQIKNDILKVLNNPFIIPEALHQEWYLAMVEDGWMYGVEKDIVSKTCPNLMEYFCLSPLVQARYEIFISIVKNSAALLFRDEIVKHTGIDFANNAQAVSDFLLTQAPFVME